MEMLKVFENRSEICEGEERECVPSTLSAQPPKLKDHVAYIVFGRLSEPRGSSRI
jgi:hypothetical protein